MEAVQVRLTPPPRDVEAPAPGGAQVWRLVPRDIADVLCVESAGDLPPRIQARCAVMIVRTPSVVRLESSRSVVLQRNSLLVVPSWTLSAVRSIHPASGADDAARTLLVGSDWPFFALMDRPVVVAAHEVGAQLAAEVEQLRRPVRSVESALAFGFTLEDAVRRGAAVPRTRARLSAAPLAPIRDHLRATLHQPVTTSELTRLSGLSEWHLIRAFHREFGLPPHAYHVRLRLAAACDLLAKGIAVSAAAYECGFADQSHLSRKFKEVFGITPAAWAAAASAGQPVPPRTYKLAACAAGRGQ